MCVNFSHIVAANEDSPQERLLWIDIARGQTTLLVIAFHATGLLRHGTGETPALLTKVNQATEPYWLSTFSFLSGYLADVPDGAADYLSERAQTLLYPFGLWTCVHAATFRVKPTPRAVLRLATGGTYLFFLPYLFAFYATAYVGRDIPPEYLALSAWGASAIGPRTLPDVPERFTVAFPHMLAMFMLGRWAREHPERWSQALASRRLVATGVAATVSGAAARLKDRNVTYAWNWAWAPALAMVAFAKAASAAAHSPVSRPLSFVGRNSIAYYTMHYPVAYGVIRLLGRRGATSGLTTFLGAASAATLVPTVVARARRRSRIARRLFSL
jgi:fucose 4-O-acetylase-like acetyltransferase